MRSMTAYSSVHRAESLGNIQIVLRSTNFKYLDVFIHNLSAEDIELEERIKREMKGKISRGKIEAFIFLTRSQPKGISINRAVVEKYILQAKSLAKQYKLKENIKIGDILKLPHVLMCGEKKKGEDAFIFTAFKKALAELLVFKRKEGGVIKREISKNLKKLEKNIQKIKKQKPNDKVDDNGKEDIDEELSLMAFYSSKLGKKINSRDSEPKGKAIDFLTQEILRELNAASSKTKKKQPAILIVEAKNYLERIREQAQNVE